MPRQPTGACTPGLIDLARLCEALAIPISMCSTEQASQIRQETAGPPAPLLESVETYGVAVQSSRPISAAPSLSATRGARCLRDDPSGSARLRQALTRCEPPRRHYRATCRPQCAGCQAAASSLVSRGTRRSRWEARRPPVPARPPHKSGRRPVALCRLFSGRPSVPARRVRLPSDTHRSGDPANRRVLDIPANGAMLSKPGPESAQQVRRHGAN